MSEKNAEQRGNDYCDYDCVCVCVCACEIEQKNEERRKMMDDGGPKKTASPPKHGQRKQKTKEEDDEYKNSPFRTKTLEIVDHVLTSSALFAMHVDTIVDVVFTSIARESVRTLASKRRYQIDAHTFRAEGSGNEKVGMEGKGRRRK